MWGKLLGLMPRWESLCGSHGTQQEPGLCVMGSLAGKTGVSLAGGTSGGPIPGTEHPGQCRISTKLSCAKRPPWINYCPWAPSSCSPNITISL